LKIKLYQTKLQEFFVKIEGYNSFLIWFKRIKSSIKVFEDTLVKENSVIKSDAIFLLDPVDLNYNFK